jgi:hypothetical protein
MKPIVGYYRVSSDKQGRSGLGLEAQRETVTRFAEANGFEVVADEVEVETGKGGRRAQSSAEAEGGARPGPQAQKLLELVLAPTATARWRLFRGLARSVWGTGGKPASDLPWAS